jgi:hypothetical protein
VVATAVRELPKAEYFVLTSFCNGASNRTIAERLHVTNVG